MLCLSEARHPRTVISDSTGSTCLPCTLAGKPAVQEKALERFLTNLSEEARSAFTLSICDVLMSCADVTGMAGFGTTNYIPSTT